MQECPLGPKVPCMIKLRDTVGVAVFLLLVLVLWWALSALPGPHRVQVTEDAPGSYDLSVADFQNSVYGVASGWDSWPDQLYSPEELAEAEDPVSHESLDFSQVHYATHRLQIDLVPGRTYGLSFWSPGYSMALYIDGVEMARAGTPGVSREETEPLVSKRVTYFTPQNETVEIVVQTANFVHQEGSRAPTLTIGSAEGIATYERNSDLRMGVVFGCLMTAFLYHLAVFLLNRKQVSSLVFALLCLLLALASGDFLARLFPDYSWQFSIRMEYLTYLLAAAALTLLVRLLFPRVRYRGGFLLYLALCGIYGGVVIFTDSVFFTGLRTGFQAISTVMILYGIFFIALTLREKKLKNVLAFIGVLFLSLFVVADILLRYDVVAVGFLAGETFNAAGGMVMFVFCYALVLSLEQAEVNARLEESRMALVAAEERYEDLEKKHALEHRPFANIADFGLTRREAEVTLLLLDGKTRDEIAELLCISMGTVNSHCSNIYRKTRCRNVVDLVRRLRPDADEMSQAAG